MSDEAAANKNIFFRNDGTARSIGEIYHRFAKKFDGDNAVSFVTPAHARLPQSPALAAVALALPTQNITLNADVTRIANVHIPAANTTPLWNTPDDLDAILDQVNIHPLRQQITQQQLSFITQIALDAMHEATPGMMLNKNLQEQQEI
jgi:hypothetical protein